jgi:hypothetical protein
MTEQATRHEVNRKSPMKNNVTKWIRPLIGLLIVALVAYGVFSLFGGGVKKPASDRYQAVFLNNGQVFFGKLKNVRGDYLQLDSAYYSKSQDLPADATAEQKAATSNNVSLVKVGDEVYGPENSLSIKAEQVLFWQDLKKDSKVTKAIDSAKE